MRLHGQLRRLQFLGAGGLILVAAISLAASLVTGSDGPAPTARDKSARPDKPAGVVAASDGCQWSSFRGTPQLTGLVIPAGEAQQLPDRPTLLWKRDTALKIDATAAIVDGVVYLGADNLSDGMVMALDLANGQDRWRVKLDNPVSAAVTVAGDRLLVGDEGGQLHALQAATGKILWTTKAQDKIAGSAMVVGDRVLFGSYDGHLYCVSLASGQAIWKYKTEDQPVNCTPAVADGVAYISGCDQYLRGIEIASGRQTLEIDMGGQAGASAAVVGNHAYVGTFANEFLGMDLKAGQVVWRYKPEREQPFYSSAAVTATHVIVGGRDRNVHCLDRQTGKALWTFRTRAKIDASPVIVGGRVYIAGHDGRLYALTLDAGTPSGQLLWQEELGASVAASPAVAEGRLVIANSDGVIFCFGRPR